MLTPKQYELVGRLTIDFSDLETAIEICAANLMGADSIFVALRVVRSAKTLDGRLSMLKEILNGLARECESFEPLVKDVLLQIERVYGLKDKRNKVVHSQSYEDRASGETVLRNPKREVVSEQHVVELIEDISATTLAVYDAANKLVAQISYEAFESKRLRELDDSAFEAARTELDNSFPE
jgi:hypothetical protein